MPEVTPRELTHQMAFLTILHRVYMQKACDEFNVYPGQIAILKYIEKNDGCTQREVAQTLHISPPSVATSIKRMQRAGLLTKLSVSSDLRRSSLSVTKAGRETARQCSESMEKLNSRMFHGFAQKELDELGAYFTRLTDNLDLEGDWRGKSFYELLEACNRRKEKV